MVSRHYHRQFWKKNSTISVTRRLKTISPNFWKKWPKIPYYLQQSLIWKPKTSTLNYFGNFKILKTNHGLKLHVWVKIGSVKSSTKSEILPNLVTLSRFFDADKRFCLKCSFSEKCLWPKRKRKSEKNEILQKLAPQRLLWTTSAPMTQRHFLQPFIKWDRKIF